MATSSNVMSGNPMLMIHGRHIAVDWSKDDIKVAKPFPPLASDFDGTDVFVPFNSALYLRGGRVYRVGFLDSPALWGGSATESSTEGEYGYKDVMLCRVAECNVCNTSLPAPQAPPELIRGPMVHRVCLQDDGAGEGWSWNPVVGLINDYAHDIPNCRQETVTFNDGQTRQVFACKGPGSETCRFCDDIEAGKTIAKPDNSKAAKRMESVRKNFKKGAFTKYLAEEAQQQGREARDVSMERTEFGDSGRDTYTTGLKDTFMLGKAKGHQGSRVEKDDDEEEAGKRRRATYGAKMPPGSGKK